ncbi:MAG: hypothetical protein ACI9FJ_002127 [Alteromonadaceae bacterium]|jgi:hypothetical protein
MSNLYKTTPVKKVAAKVAAKMGLGLVLIVASVSASAKDVSFKEMVDYRITQQMQAIHFAQKAELQQGFYANLHASIYSAYNATGSRPVVTISDAKVSDEEE